MILFYILQKTRENIYISEAQCANDRILLKFNFDILILILLMGVSSDVKAKLSGFFKTSYLLSGRKFTSATTLAVCFSENQN